MIFHCSRGVGAPNSCVVQGSTVIPNENSDLQERIEIVKTDKCLGKFRSLLLSILISENT